MSRAVAGDFARQAANVVGAIFHVVAGLVLASGELPKESITLIQPATYAFVIWGAIFLSLLAYAAYQALPANRENPLLRRIGWFTAAAFICTGLWSVFVPLRQFGLAQLMLLAIFVFLLIAYLCLSRSVHEHALSKGERWLVALPLGPFLGWVTAANAVSLTAEAVRRDLAEAGELARRSSAAPSCSSGPSSRAP